MPCIGKSLTRAEGLDIISNKMKDREGTMRLENLSLALTVLQLLLTVPVLAKVLQMAGLSMPVIFDSRMLAIALSFVIALLSLIKLAISRRYRLSR